jgi:dihydroflavonol-4-reductase
VVVVNPSVPVGPGDRRRGPLTRMIYDLLRGRTRGFFLDGQINLIDVRDVAAGVCAAALRGQAGRRYLLANETWEIRRLLDTLAKMAGMPAPRWAAPYPLALAFAWLEELWCRHVSGRQPMATVTGVRLTRRSFAMDGSSSLAALGVRPHAVIHALFETVMQLRASMDQQVERCPVVEEAVA